MVNQLQRRTSCSTQTGRIHSVETCGTVDGPGIRYVVFTQGCPLRCLYCHNPDCREITGGKVVTVSELLTDILRYRAYIDSSGGGVTVTGGEPLLQPEFVTEFFKACQQQGLHTTLDTSGFSEISAAQRVLQYTDLVLLDIKSFDPDIYHQVTQVSLEPTLRLARYLNEMQIPAWIRFVLVPGLTNSVNNVEGLAQFVSKLTNVKRVEILPFHQMGAYKWEQLGFDYKLKDVLPPTADQVQQVKDIFLRYGLRVES
ncbi:pyruvate formate-lyase activating enzyme [Leptolyngbya sp. Heron Island J]|uniref:pyruvate formate-lyase-activating protein n=1 Tax=Leptolyngbya sp. Heron Island J TaxID=1385935 RepID=UPI0003B940B5|nr:pyruvate formate-lyase-activating protein [Leptolyngbya sp. Heron Island J]ESA33599.1 pyruvate formate-lyase activating enzyme [Leptolyngbya sp. Heron Island J]